MTRPPERSGMQQLLGRSVSVAAELESRPESPLRVPETGKVGRVCRPVATRAADR
jgi:hypothetical protein